MFRSTAEMVSEAMEQHTQPTQSALSNPLMLLQQQTDTGLRNV